MTKIVKEKKDVPVVGEELLVDFANYSKAKETISHIQEQIDAELLKGGEADFDFIESCCTQLKEEEVKRDASLQTYLTYLTKQKTKIMENSWEFKKQKWVQKYGEEDPEVIHKLKDGDFSNIDLEHWLSKHFWKYIDGMIDGCDKTNNGLLLSILFGRLCAFMKHPNGLDFGPEMIKDKLMFGGSGYPGLMEHMSYSQLVDFLNKEIIHKCRFYILKIVEVAVKKYRKESLKGNSLLEYARIMERASTSDDEEIRKTWCAKYATTPEDYLNDLCESVRKIATIRCSFAEYWKETASELDRDFILYLASALENHEIGYSTHDCRFTDDEDRMWVIYQSRLFEHKLGDDHADRNVVEIIADQRILALNLYNAVCEGKLKFCKECLPEKLQKAYETIQNEIAEQTKLTYQPEDKK